MNPVDNKEIDLGHPSLYNNRELSWLAFNERVLQEALDESNPLGERLKFLAIFSSNLDEFFMVRVAGLKDQVKAGFNKPENKAGLTPKEQLSAISKKCHQIVGLQYETYRKKLLPLLEKENIFFRTMEELNNKQEKYLENMFEEQIFPVLTPMAIDAYRPFPLLANKTINLAILLDDPLADEKNREKFAIVQVPAVLDRFIKLPTDDQSLVYVMLEDVISHYVDRLFRGYVVKFISKFRITRNADMTIHEEGARDLLMEIEKELKKRKWGAAVRLEVCADSIDEKLLDYLAEVLEIHEKDIYTLKGPLDLTFLFSFYKEMAAIKDTLVFETLIPQPPLDLIGEDDIFQAIAKKDILLHHPYESFEAVVDFISHAARDPDVLAIKQTLYRVSGDSPIIESLKRAAENGKQVTVLVELKARFDEEKNVQWAKELEKAGCHVIFGMTHLKTHSKITLVVRKRNQQIERFVHLSTGNYNDVTAKIYTDLGFLTANREFAIDATNFFNYLSGYTERPVYHHLSVSPYNIRKDFIQLIDAEIDFHKKYKNGKMILKMNALTDKALIMKLYEASRAGVKIDLFVRGICCLKAGITGVSENIRVKSIIGRFLEHSRIYYFYHNGDEKIFLSSADMMTRNMERRVEILFPILDKRIKDRIKTILTIINKDNVKAREMDCFGNYHYVKRGPNEEKIESQMVLFEMAYHVKDDEE
ncbi:RNA degradosome polyphosphate kinase [Calidifontibacillus erzurumensis]|uniref:Polyphosphate kinase n=1 Tax=Calidifontibacillus erzurumensis TaxID=2741433 RepID=A0A8J8GCM7_9BACI|nr:RNA degradosome polyphosphate kinase [Calidifontibacillus erzurumensis]NSL50696.1 RNA degradosome polyphosphate kinase [Calidifontibacillus erzurumensis]